MQEYFGGGCDEWKSIFSLVATLSRQLFQVKGKLYNAIYDQRLMRQSKARLDGLIARMEKQVTSEEGKDFSRAMAAELEMQMRHRELRAKYVIGIMGIVIGGLTYGLLIIS